MAGKLCFGNIFNLLWADKMKKFWLRWLEFHSFDSEDLILAAMQRFWLLKATVGLSIRNSPSVKLSSYNLDKFLTQLCPSVLFSHIFSFNFTCPVPQTSANFRSPIQCDIHRLIYLFFYISIERFIALNLSQHTIDLTKLIWQLIWKKGRKM